MAVQQHAFPEIEGPDFVRSSDVEAVAEKVLELHGGVGGVGRIREVAEAIRDQELRIMWLLNEKPFNEDTEDDQEPEIAGRCIKAPRLWHDVTGVDFAIWARKHFWDDFNTELRRALVLHELEHIEVKRDKNGQPKYSVRKHDVEDFVDVARQYGPAALAGQGGRYVRAAALFAGEPEPILTKGHEVVGLAHDAADALLDGSGIGPDAAVRAEVHRDIDATAAETPPAAAVCAEKFGPQRRLICTREPGHKGHHVDSEVRPS
jgi:hypothetical protein